MKLKYTKILLCLIAVITLLSITSFAADEPKVMSGEEVNVIKLLEIANGYQNGNMNYGSNVTRAEFIKMAISTSQGKNTALNTKLNISLFPDVRNTHWAAGYVYVAIENGLVNGYLDGTFKPSNNVTLEEAVTIVLRLLGYSDADLVGKYPTAQLSKYKDLELDNKISAVQGEKLTREECMILLYNMLSTKTKSGAIFCTTLGYSVNSQGDLDYTALLEQKLSGPYIVKDLKSLSFKDFSVNSKTAMRLNNADSSVSNLKVNDVIYTSKAINTVFAYRKTATGIVDFKTASTVTIGGKAYTLATADAIEKFSLGGAFGEEKSFVTLLLGLNDAVVDVIEGDVSMISGNTDNAAYNAMIDATISQPICVTTSEKLNSWKNDVPVDIASATVYVNGKTTSSASVSLGDVIYYSKPFKSIWIFRETKSGIINSFSTSTISVDNSVYTLGSNDVKFKLSGYGSFSVGDYVTVILGKNSEVVDIQKLVGPIIVEDTDSPFGNNSFTENDTTKFLLNGNSSSKSQIKINDIVYISSVDNTVYIYRKTATGIVEASTSSTVTLGNRVYPISTDSAKQKFSLGGIFSEDKSFVTLLLGINDNVIDAINGNVDLIDSNSDNSTYIEMIDSTISSPIYIENAEILENWKSKIPLDFTNTTVYVNGKETDFVKVVLNDVIYYSKPFDSVWIYRNTQSGIIGSVSTSVISVGNKSYMLATNNAKFKVSTYGEYEDGDYVTLILGKNSEVVDIKDANTFGLGLSDNDASYSEIVTSSLKGPYVTGKNGEMSYLTIEAENSTVYLDNKQINASDIKPYDVYYFSDVLDTIWIYRETVSGTIEKITPASSPASVVVSGNTYTINNSQASYDLSTFGLYNVGDKVTLLLGMDDCVAGVTTPDNISGIIYGIVTATGEKSYTDRNGDEYTSNYVTVTDTTGAAYTYEYASNYFKTGDIVRVSVGSSVQITKINQEIGRATAANLSYSFKNGSFSDDCEIIDVYGSSIIKVTPERLEGCKLDADHFLYTSVVLYYEYDEDNNIKKLILNNFTGDIDDYGVVVSSKNGTIGYKTDNVDRSFTTVSGNGCSAGPARLRKENGAYVSASPLTGCVSDVDLITDKAVYDTSNKEYLLSDDVCVFIKNTNTSYTYSSVEEITSGNYTYYAYYDKLPDYGGRIRVIVAVKKY